MSTISKERFFNIPVLINGWNGDVGAKVESLVDLPEFGIVKGQPFVASLREDPKKIEKYQITFKTHRDKNALRVGGIVLLRKTVVGEEGEITAQSADILLESPKYGQTYMFPGSAVSIFPPPPGSMVVDEAYVASLNDAVTVRKPLRDVLSDFHLKLEFVSAFGLAGLVLTGEDEGGEVSEYLVFAKPELDIKDIERSLEVSISKEMEKRIIKAKKPWFLVPVFKAPVDLDPLRRSKLSAMRTNFDYGSGSDLNWTPCHCLMKTPGDIWYVNDVTPVEDKTTSSLLIDILENRG